MHFTLSYTWGRCAFVYFKDFRAAEDSTNGLNVSCYAVAMPSCLSQFQCEGAIKVLDNKYKIRQKAVDPIQAGYDLHELSQPCTLP